MSAAPPRVYLDANVFVTAFESVGAHSDHAWWIMRATENGEIVGATSELTLAEILVKPIELGASGLVEAYDRMIAPAPNFEVLAVARDVLIEAAHIRARQNSVRLPDAIHIASARKFECGFFVSEGRRLPLPEPMVLLGVTPFTVDEILGRRP